MTRSGTTTHDPATHDPTIGTTTPSVPTHEQED